MRYQGKLYRALNPRYAFEPLSGKGAELYGGRFNPKGMAALYTSLSVMTAVREANQVGNLQPTTLVSYDADIDRVFDSRDVDALTAHGMTVECLATPSWRDQMKANGIADTQDFARRLTAQGFNALLVRSFAPGSSGDDLNLIVWHWGNAVPCRLHVIDDEARLVRLPAS